MKSNRKINWIIYLMGIAMTFASCFLVPCVKNISIFSDVDNFNITICDYENEKKLIALKNIEITEDISRFHSGSFIIIESSKVYQVLQFGEYDHWFSARHMIRIKIVNDTITYSGGGLNIRLVTESKEEFRNIQKSYYTD